MADFHSLQQFPSQTGYLAWRRWNCRTRLALLGWSLIALCLSPQAGCRAVEEEDQYFSENRSTEARSSVLGEMPEFKGPAHVSFHDLDGMEIHAAKDVNRIAGLVNRDAMVIGKVDSVFIPTGENKVILNFGKDFRNCFKAVIDIRDYPKWGTTDAEKIAKFYEGLNVSVDGLVSSYQNKPQIIVSLPHQLQIVTGP